MNHIFKVRIPYGVLEGFFMKYVWSAVGLLMIGIYVPLSLSCPSYSCILFRP